MTGVITQAEDRGGDAGDWRYNPISFQTISPKFLGKQPEGKEGDAGAPSGRKTPVGAVHTEGYKEGLIIIHRESER